MSAVVASCVAGATIERLSPAASIVPDALAKVNDFAPATPVIVPIAVVVPAAVTLFSVKTGVPVDAVFANAVDPASALATYIGYGTETSSIALAEGFPANENATEAE